ncbi:MAG: hypothetical protein R6U44_10025 [Archaeoglobaceae archaeon]
MNLATQLLTLVFMLVAIVVVYLLVRGTRSIGNPYNKVLKGIFVLGLVIVLLSMASSVILEGNGVIAAFIGLGKTIIGIGVVILCWEKFKEGYADSVSEKEESE